MPKTSVKSYWDSGNLHFAQDPAGIGSSIILDDIPITGMTPGITYYVNNITGSASNDGLTWATALDQVSTAITKQAAYSLARTGVAPTAAGFYGRDRILIMGTGTTYTVVATAPQMCDLIGVGATPAGNGTGIAVIGDATGAAHGFSGTSRGLYMANIQCVGAGSYYAANFVALYRSTLENCAFGGNNLSAACARALSITAGSGTLIKNCRTIMHAAAPVIGMCFAEAGGNFNECQVEDCFAYGSTTGMSNKGYLSDGAVFKNNIAYGGTTGIIDAGAGGADASVAFWYNNFGSGATTGVTCSASATVAERHFMNNYSVSNVTSAIYYALGA
jgi:hypothetical protein